MFKGFKSLPGRQKPYSMKPWPCVQYGIQGLWTYYDTLLTHSHNQKWVEWTRMLGSGTAIKLGVWGVGVAYVHHNRADQKWMWLNRRDAIPLIHWVLDTPGRIQTPKARQRLQAGKVGIAVLEYSKQTAPLNLRTRWETGFTWAHESHPDMGPLLTCTESRSAMNNTQETKGMLTARWDTYLKANAWDKLWPMITGCLRCKPTKGKGVHLPGWCICQGAGISRCLTHPQQEM